MKHTSWTNTSGTNRAAFFKILDICISTFQSLVIMKTETTDREDYKRPEILVINEAMSSNLLVESDEYYYQGAPDD
jgi:hypothetical protein